METLNSIAEVRAIVSRTGHNAMAISNQFGANYATTNLSDALKDINIDALLISTRHDLHASMALSGLKAGKHVLVEKPLALNQAELDSIVSFYNTNKQKKLPFLLLIHYG